MTTTQPQSLLPLTATKSSLLLEEGAAMFTVSKLSSPIESEFPSCSSSSSGQEGKWVMIQSLLGSYSLGAVECLS